MVGPFGELRQRLLDARSCEVSPKESAIVRAERDEENGDAGTTARTKTVKSVVRRWGESGTGCGSACSGADPDASGRLGHGEIRPRRPAQTHGRGLCGPVDSILGHDLSGEPAPTLRPGRSGGSMASRRSR